MWIGVIVMIATMINWVRIMMPAPLATAHDQLRWDCDAAVNREGVVPSFAVWDDSARARLRASTSGSGRKNNHSTTAPATYATAASMNGPDRAGEPILVAKAPVILTRLGPRIAPTAVATRTMLTARPRRDGAARSAPA